MLNHVFSGYVYAESPGDVNVRQSVDMDDDNAKFERMEDNTIRLFRHSKPLN